MTLTERALGILRPLSSELVVVRALPGMNVADGVHRVAEPVPGAGPGPALAAAFEALDADVWLAAPCDMPCLSTSLYRRLLQEGRGYPGAFFVTEGRLQPLVSVFFRSGAAGLKRDLETNGARPLHGVLTGLGFLTVEASAAELPGFLNVNRAEDWERLIQARSGTEVVS